MGASGRMKLSIDNTLRTQDALGSLVQQSANLLVRAATGEGISTGLVLGAPAAAEALASALQQPTGAVTGADFYL